MATNISKVTVSLPDDSLDELDAVAAVLGVTRSAALSAILNHTLTRAQNRLVINTFQDYELRQATLKRYTSSSKAQIDRDLDNLILGSED